MILGIEDQYPPQEYLKNLGGKMVRINFERMASRCILELKIIPSVENENPFPVREKFLYSKFFSSVACLSNSLSCIGSLLFCSQKNL
jgi:hypothetical protein